MRSLWWVHFHGRFNSNWFFILLWSVQTSEFVLESFIVGNDLRDTVLLFSSLTFFYLVSRILPKISTVWLDGKSRRDQILSPLKDLFSVTVVNCISGIGSRAILPGKFLPLGQQGPREFPSYVPTSIPKFIKLSDGIQNHFKYQLRKFSQSYKVVLDYFFLLLFASRLFLYTRRQLYIAALQSSNMWDYL